MPLKRQLKIVRKDDTKAEKFLELLNQVKMYKDSEQIRLAEIEAERIKKVESMLKVSTRIKLDMMRLALEMDEKTFTEEIFKWANKFDFVVDGDFLIVNVETIPDFLGNLYGEHDNLRKRRIKTECIQCGKPIEYYARICPFCGKEQI